MKSKSRKKAAIGRKGAGMVGKFSGEKGLTEDEARKSAAGSSKGSRRK